MAEAERVAPFRPTRDDFAIPVPPVVDAVAEALFEADATIHDFKIAWSDVGDYRRFCYQLRAKAAIQAMRKPSEAMVDALNRVPGGWGVGAWSVGIDAALAVPDEGQSP